MLKFLMDEHQREFDSCPKEPISDEEFADVPVALALCGSIVLLAAVDIAVVLGAGALRARKADLAREGRVVADDDDLRRVAVVQAGDGAKWSSSLRDPGLAQTFAQTLGHLAGGRVGLGHPAQ